MIAKRNMLFLADSVKSSLSVKVMLSVDLSISAFRYPKDKSIDAAVAMSDTLILNLFRPTHTLDSILR